MRKHAALLTLALFVSLASSASAISLRKLEGVWKGRRTESFNGSGSFSSAKFVTKRRADGGFSITETGTSKLIGGQYVFKHVFKAGGKYQSSSFYQGILITSNSGKWVNLTDSISISGAQITSGGSSKFKGSLRLISSNKVAYTGSSGGITVKISATR